MSVDVKFTKRIVVTTTEGRRRVSISVSQQTKEVLDLIKHPGQSYEGVIQELIQLWKKAHPVEEKGQGH